MNPDNTPPWMHGIDASQSQGSHLYTCVNRDNVEQGFLSKVIGVMKRSLTFKDHQLINVPCTKYYTTVPPY